MVEQENEAEVVLGVGVVFTVLLFLCTGHARVGAHLALLRAVS